MRVLYLDCSMGAAGDMLMAALYELLDDKPAFLDAMRALGLPGIEITAEPAVKCGITGTHMKVLVHGEESWTHCTSRNTVMVMNTRTITRGCMTSNTCCRIWTCRRRCKLMRWRSTG